MKASIYILSLICFLSFSSSVIGNEAQYNIRDKKGEIVLTFEGKEGYSPKQMVCFKPEGYVLADPTNELVKNHAPGKVYTPQNASNVLAQHIIFKKIPVQANIPADRLLRLFCFKMKRALPSSNGGVIQENDMRYGIVTSVQHTKMNTRVCVVYLFFVAEDKGWIWNDRSLIRVKGSFEYDTQVTDLKNRYESWRKLMSLIRSTRS